MPNSYLVHYGIEGQKWGIRRYQNFDGSYTEAGLKRYNRSRKDYEEYKSKYDSTKKLYKESKKKWIC